MTPNPALCPGPVSNSTTDLIRAEYLFCLFSLCTSSAPQVSFQFFIISATQLGLVGFQDFFCGVLKI